MQTFLSKEQIARLSPRGRWILRIVGVLVLVGGIALAVAGFSQAFGGHGAGMGAENFDEGRNNMLSGMLTVFGGMVLVAIGGAMVQFSFLKVVSELVATETGGAVEYGSHRFGRGLGRGLKEARVEVVRIKCRDCGELETETAKFCSGCGTAM